MSGTLTVADLRNGNPEACTLLPAFSSTPAGRESRSEGRTRSILAATDAGATIVEGDFPAEPEVEARPSREVDAVVFWGPRLNFYLRRGLWLLEDWGPPPGQIGCFVPEELLAEYGIITPCVVRPLHRPRPASPPSVGARPRSDQAPPTNKVAD